MLDAVNDPKRISITIHRGNTTNTDIVSASGVTTSLCDNHARSCTLQSLRDVHWRTALHLLGVHRGDRTRDITFLHCTVTNDYDLIECFIVFT